MWFGKRFIDVLINAKGEVCLGRVAHNRNLLLPGLSKCTSESSLSEEGACHRFRCENPKVLVLMAVFLTLGMGSSGDHPHVHCICK